MCDEWLRGPDSVLLLEAKTNPAWGENIASRSGPGHDKLWLVNGGGRIEFGCVGLRASMKRLFHYGELLGLELNSPSRLHSPPLHSLPPPTSNRGPVSGRSLAAGRPLHRKCAPAVVSPSRPGCGRAMPMACPMAMGVVGS